MDSLSSAAEGATPQGVARFALHVEGKEAHLRVTCERCGMALTIRSELDSMSRAFLKSFFKGRDGNISGLVKEASVLCDACDSARVAIQREAERG